MQIYSYLRHLDGMCWKAQSTESPPRLPPQESPLECQKKAFAACQPQHQAQILLAADVLESLPSLSCLDEENTRF